MPGANSYSAVTSRELAGLKVTANTKLPSPSDAVASPTVTAGGPSSSTIVPTATPSASVPPWTLDSASVTVSSSSAISSSTKSSKTSLAVSPGANVTVPESGPP